MLVSARLPHVRPAVFGAWLNVKINAAGLRDREKADAILAEAEKIAEEAARRESDILKVVNETIAK